MSLEIIILRSSPPHPGLSPSTAGLSSPLRLPWVGPLGLRAPAEGPTTPHPSTVIPWRFGLGYPPFGRPYSGDPILVSLPPPTKMFPFGGFPIGTPGGVNPHGFPIAGGCYPPAGGPIRGSRVQRPPAPTPGLSQLATPFLGARAEPSTGRLNADEPWGGVVQLYWGLCAALILKNNRAIHSGAIMAPELHEGLPQGTHVG